LSDHCVDVSQWRQARTRLFLSADIAGSTAYKQRKTDETAPTKQWAQAILSFYRDFGQHFFTKLILAEEHAARRFDYERCSRPLFWKAVGDEVLFCVELASEKQAYIVISAWINAAREYKKTLRKERLDIKISAWLATFPTPNFEVVLPRSLGAVAESPSDAEDALLANWKTLETYYASSADQQKNYSLDFIGPAIDTGFRIAQQSTIRKMAITPELARIIALTHHHFENLSESDAIYTLDLRYEGRTSLKGVGDPIGYPVFWIDVASLGDKMIVLEDQLDANARKPSNTDVKAFLEEYVRHHAPFRAYLYLPRAEHKEFSQLDSELASELDQIRALYEREDARLRSEMNQSDLSAETEGETVPLGVLEQLVNGKATE
jgi:hypothetical protein